MSGVMSPLAMQLVALDFHSPAENAAYQTPISLQMLRGQSYFWLQSCGFWSVVPITDHLSKLSCDVSCALAHSGLGKRTAAFYALPGVKASTGVQVWPSSVQLSEYLSSFSAQGCT